MFRFSAGFLLTAIIVLAAAVNSHAAPGQNIRRFAMIVGANNGGPERVQLRYAVSDASTMMNVLKLLGGVDSRDALLLHNPDRRNFISALARVKGEIQGARSGKDRIEFIFYYSGHSDSEAILLGREKVFYKELKDGIRGIPADVRIAILDSCSSGAFTRIKGGSFKAPFLLDTSFNMKGDAFMTSSSSDEASQESEAIKGSFFTYYLVSGLRGSADMIRDGRITLNEAYQYAYNETLARTEKTSGGAQHPNYDIQMTGTGDVVITDVRRSTSGVILDKRISGRIYIRNDERILVAETYKSYGSELEIALEEGKYSITNHSGNNISETSVKLSSEERISIAQEQFRASFTEYAVLRGDKQTPADEKQKKEIMLDIDRIEHGWYFGLANQYTRLNGQWADFVGARGGWIINHSILLGISGYGLVYPTNREGLTGKIYEGEEKRISMGFGGPMIEYFFHPDRLFTFAPALTVAGGSFEYIRSDDEDNEDESDHADTFFVIMPEFYVYANITEYIRIGIGVSYRHSAGINKLDLDDNDFRNVSVNIMVAGGWF
jgi:hypothetical protein